MQKTILTGYAVNKHEIRICIYIRYSIIRKVHYKHYLTIKSNKKSAIILSIFV